MRLTEQDIIKIVCDYYELNYNAVVNSICKKKELAEARQVSMFLIKKYFEKRSLEKIGQLFKGKGKTGNKDHATVIHGIATTQKRIDLYQDFRKNISAIESKIDTKEEVLESYHTAIWAENDYYYNDRRDIAVFIRKAIEFLKYHFYPPNPFKSVEKGIAVNGYSGFREHSR